MSATSAVSIAAGEPAAAIATPTVLVLDEAERLPEATVREVFEEAVHRFYREGEGEER